MMYRLAIYVALITTIVFGKSYTIDNVEIQSIIGKDGIVQITEKRVFTFNIDCKCSPGPPTTPIDLVLTKVPLIFFNLTFLIKSI